MRSFEAELQTLLGWHDGLQVHLSHEAGDRLMVAQHERAHADIFSNTPDGHLLSLCVRHLNHLNGDSKVIWKRRVADYFEKCRKAHESAATYLGIKNLITEQEREQEVANLPTQYLEWYNNYAGLIDDICLSTFIQVGFARAISSVIFSSRALLRFINDQFDSKVLEDPQFWPDTRQKKFSQWWADGGKEAAVQHVRTLLLDTSELRAVAFSQGPNDDIFGELTNDEGWPADADLGITLDGYIISNLYRFLVENVPFDCLSSDSAEYVEAAHRLTPLVEAWGMQHEVVSGGSRTNPKGNLYIHEKIGRFRTAATTQWHIKSVMKGLGRKPATRLNLRDSYLFDRFQESAVSFIYSGTDIVLGDAHIEIFSPTGTTDGVGDLLYEFSDHFSCSCKTATQLLSNFMYERHFGRERVYLGVILAPFEGFTGTANRHVIYEMLHTHPALPQIKEDGSAISLRPRRMIHDRELFWYVHDEWPDLLDIAPFPPTQVAAMRVAVDGFPECLLSILHMADRPGHFLKAVPVPAAGPMVEYHNDLVATGKVLKMPEEQAAKVLKRASDAIRAAAVYWNRL